MINKTLKVFSKKKTKTAMPSKNLEKILTLCNTYNVVYYKHDDLELNFMPKNNQEKKTKQEKSILMQDPVTYEADMIKKTRGY